MFIDKYPYTEFSEYNLDWIIRKIRELTNDYLTDHSAIVSLQTGLSDLRTYVDDYFENLDLNDELREILDSMVEDGTFTDLINESLFPSSYAAIDSLLSNQAVHIGFLGDSITYGALIADDTQDSNNYPAVIQRLATDFGYQVTCHNYGVSGQPSSVWQTQFNRALNANCKIVSFCFGHNDFRLGNSIDSLLSNISSFITACRENDILPVVCSTPPYYGTTSSRVFNGATVAAAIKNICEQRSAVYVPLYEDLESMFNTASYNVMTMMTDGVHFIDYTLLAEIWIAYALMPMVANKEGTLKIAWRNSGTKMVNVTASTLSQSHSGRVANLKGNSIYEMYIYSRRPWVPYTISCDYRGAGLVSWDFDKYNFSRSESTDYCRPNITSVNDAVQGKKQIYDGTIPAGLTKIKLNSIVQSPQYAASAPLLYLCDFYVEEVPYRLSLH